MTIAEYIKDRNINLFILIENFNKKSKTKKSKSKADPTLSLLDDISELSPEDLKLLKQEIIDIGLSLEVTREMIR